MLAGWAAEPVPVGDAANRVLESGVVGALLILALIGGAVLWRRDVKRSDEALTYERSQTAAATARAERAETALAEQNREIRSEIVPAITRTTEIAAEYVQQLRAEPRRRSG